MVPQTWQHHEQKCVRTPGDKIFGLGPFAYHNPYGAQHAFEAI